jgi:UDP-N-acetylmuramyl pentapeptide phosphotransferase/UDP-N-acetylglucosamine-1-phosphate transferase
MSFGFNRNMSGLKRIVNVINRRPRVDDAGVTSLEVALVFGIFVILMFGTIDLSRYFFSQHELNGLVAAAARQGLIDPTFTPCGGPPNSWSAFPAIVPLLDQSQVGLCVTQPFFPLGVQVLTVTGTYNFTTITPGLDGLSGMMTASVTYQY